MADNSETAAQLLVVSKYPCRILMLFIGARLERKSDKPINRQNIAELRKYDQEAEVV